jgi:hypothetical protein
MTHYLLTSGILSAKIVRYTEDYVFLQLKFEGQESDFKQLTRDNFDGLDKWVKESYNLIKKII